LSASAQNALLKTLEEPPPGTVLILACEAEERLLPTVRSRCARIALRPPPRSRAAAGSHAGARGSGV
jgi:DNA polymerase-3 subunit delta'